MRTDLTLPELADKIQLQTANKVDYVTDTRQLFATASSRLQLKDNEEVQLDINPHCHGQLSQRLKIPKPYYDRLRDEHPDLLGHTLNTFFNREPKMRMVRALNGVARAFVSNKFRTDIDNYDVANITLPLLGDVPDMNIVSCSITDTRMYIKALFPRLRGEVKVGDVVQGGIVISNSEVGSGSLRIEPLLYQLICLNGMISGTAMKKYHVGAAQQYNEEAEAVFSEETRRKMHEALAGQIRDVVKTACDQTDFNKRLDALKAAAGEELGDKIPETVTVLSKQLGFTEDEKDNVLKHLIKGADLTKYGLANAVTRTASDIEDYDRATEFERAGGKVIKLSGAAWTVIKEAA